MLPVRQVANQNIGSAHVQIADNGLAPSFSELLGPVFICLQAFFVDAWAYSAETGKEI